MAINSGDLGRAEALLNHCEDHGAEWNFLKGAVCYRRGWMDEARRYYQNACQMDPGNMEYQSAMNMAQGRRSGNYGPYNGYGGYNPNVTRSSGTDACDICSTLLCADCCCECMGGDLIPCC